MPNTVKAAAVAVLGAVLFGSEIGYWAQANSSISFNRAMTGNANVTLSATELDLVTTYVYLVGLVFALPPLTRIFADGFGRRITIIISGLLFALAVALQASAANVAYPASKSMMIAGRCLLGVPVAFSITTAPMFLSEISPKEYRGAIGGLFQFTLMVFIVIAGGIGLLVKKCLPDDEDAFQYMLWWMVPVGLLVSFFTYMSNETPYFLLLKGKEAEAETVLFHLRKGAEEKQIQKEFEMMQTDISAEKALGEATYKELFSGFPLRILLICCFAQFLNQLAGVNFLNNFAPTIMNGLQLGDPDLLAWVATWVQFIGTVPSMLLVDRVGRRPLLIGGSAFLLLCWITLAILGITSFTQPEECLTILDCPAGAMCNSDAVFTSQEMAVENVCGAFEIGTANYTSCSTDLSLTPSDPFNMGCMYTGQDGAPSADNPYPDVDVALGSFVIALYYIINFVYGLTVGPVVWTYNPEIAPTKFRAVILGFSVTTNLFWNGFVTFVPGIVFSIIGLQAFWIFAVVMVVAIAFFYWIVETKGLALEAVTEKYEEKLNIKYTGLHISDNSSETDSEDEVEGDDIA